MRTLPHSTLQLMWADFGAGKSHTLRHIQHLCTAEGQSPLLGIYTETPVGPLGVDVLYRSFIEGVPQELLNRAALKIQRSTVSGASAIIRDLYQALTLLISGDYNSRAIATEWLSAPRNSPPLQTLRSYGLNSRIDSEEKIIQVMSELLKVLLSTRTYDSVVFLIDEFQRVADIQLKKREIFLKSLVSLFNSCTSGLHMVLSFSVAQQSTVEALIPPDLLSRARTFPILPLSYLSEDEAYEFVTDLFAAFRNNPAQGKAYPFTDPALRFVVQHVSTRTGGRVTPRALMDMFSQVLFELDDKDPRWEILPVDVSALKRVPTLA